jgi:ABC-type glycerol-3-phosphate transport system permease component
VLLALALYAAPFFWQALTSVRPDAELLPLTRLWPSRLTWAHYDVVVREA